MSSKRYAEDSRLNGQAGHDGAKHSLYHGIKRFGRRPSGPRPRSQQEEMRRLKAELRWVTEERDILKGRGVLCGKVCLHPCP